MNGRRFPRPGSDEFEQAQCIKCWGSCQQDLRPISLDVVLIVDVHHEGVYLLQR